MKNFSIKILPPAIPAPIALKLVDEVAGGSIN